MGVLYRFSPEAYWHRSTSGTSGPLVTPIFKKMKTGSGKEKNYGDDFIAYLKRLNPDPSAFAHIISKDYGPSKGIRKNGKIRMNMLVYPGPDNYVLIEKIIGNWGIVAGLDEDKIPAMKYTHDTHPWLIHKVYGSNKKGTAVLLKDTMYLPILSSGRFIQMKWLMKG